MAKRSSPTIARKAQAKAEADFATWLMMAKLGGFDDLPPHAQRWLEGYRTRLGQHPESEAMMATIREVYAAYYADMGGAGEAPDLAADVPPTDAQVVDLKAARRARATRATARTTAGAAAERPRLSVPPLLIFAGMVAVLAALKFAFGN